MQKELLFSWFIGASLVLVIGWLAFEKCKENSRLYLTPEEEVALKVKQFHETMGEINGKVDRYHQEVMELKNQIPVLSKLVGESSGRVDVMREYFQKYSPETFEKTVRRLTDEVDTLRNEAKDFSSLDSRYAKKEEVARLSHLPQAWEWSNREEKLKEVIKKLEDNVDFLLKGQPAKKQVKVEVPQAPVPPAPAEELPPPHNPGGGKA